jgi:hypothetical protein
LFYAKTRVFTKFTRQYRLQEEEVGVKGYIFRYTWSRDQEGIYTGIPGVGIRRGYIQVYLE